MKEGEAEFVSSANLQCRSGQRARYEDLITVMSVEDYQQELLPMKSDSKRIPPMKPELAVRKVGTVFEVDPVLGPDNATVDLNLELVFHTAPPTESSMEVLFPDLKKPMKISVPEFHAREIKTQETMLAGTAKLIGSWRPTGKPEFEKRRSDAGGVSQSRPSGVRGVPSLRWPG